MWSSNRTLPGHLLGGLLLAALMAGCQFGRPADSASQLDPAFTPEALFEEGIKVAQSGDLAQGEVLIQLSFRRQSEHPVTVPAVWERFKAFLNSQKPKPADRAARLLAYRESLNTALLATTRREDFRKVWSVRQQVQEAIGEAGTAETDDIRKTTEALRKELSGLEDPAAILRSAEFLAELEPRLIALDRTLLAGGTAEPPPKRFDFLATTASDILAVATRAMKGSIQGADALVDESLKRKAFDPMLAEGKVGPCEMFLGQLRELNAALDESRFQRWLPFVPEATRKEFEGLHARLREQPVRVGRLQQLRYNLWATRHLNTAEDSPVWDTFLGEIDLGLLHPTVSALYSSVHDRRMQTVQDARSRAQRVQTILTRKRILIAAF